MSARLRTRFAARNNALRARPARGVAAELAPEDTDPSVSGIPQLVRIVGSIVAPTTLLTALLFYFGWSFAYWFFAYFGMDSTVLGLTTQDYLIRSVDGLFVPLTVMTSSGLLAWWSYISLQSRLTSESRKAVAAALLPVSAVAGLGLLIIGLSGVFHHPLLEFHFAVPPLCLAAGVLLLSYASRQYRTSAGTPPRETGWRELVEWAGVFVIVGLSLFWAAQGYSAGVGTSRARLLAAQLASLPDTVVYSAHSLSLHVRGVTETSCGNSDAVYRFRYDGLKLILQSGGQYVFLPRTWSPGDGPAIVIPRGDSLRLEFTLATTTGVRTPPACQ